MRKSTVLLSGLNLACALGAAWSWWQLRAEQERVIELEQRLAAAQAARTPPVQAAKSVPQDAKPSTPMVATTPPPVSTGNDTSQQQLQEQVRAAQAREREMMRDPAYRKSRIDEWRPRYAQTRADAIRYLQLPPEQADRLVELLIERNFAGVDLNPMGGPLNEEARVTWARISEQHDAQLRELLGSEKYQRWQWYQQTAGERNEVSLFRAQLSTTKTPLQEHQADALVDALHVERQRRNREYDDYATTAGITNRSVVAPQDRQRWIELERDSNQRIHDSMAGTLTRDQLASLDAMLAANVAPAEAALRLQLEGRVAKTP